MKKLLVLTLLAFSGVTFLTGCVAKVGGGSKCQTITPTLGQQLIDLKHAKDVGALTEAEYQTEKDRLLNDK